ncbi:MAG: hypothetical protein FIB01_11335 [Gemmatimonadetes bacterium]|nr:hypothetical protein [Gemmatimonadota bacterium]
MNRVRAFLDPRDRAFYLEWREGGHRCRQKLGNIHDPDAVAAKADRLAAAFMDVDADDWANPITIDGLLRLYLTERTPQKGEERQHHDRRAAR